MMKSYWKYWSPIASKVISTLMEEPFKTVSAVNDLYLTNNPSKQKIKMCVQLIFLYLM